MERVKPYPEELAREYITKGLWLGTTVIDAFDRICDVFPDKEALVEGEIRLTFSELRQRTYKAALALKKQGIGSGSFVLFQVPNWAENIYLYLALQAIGAIPILVLPRHGQKELERFCALTGADTWIGPANFGKIDYMPMVRTVREKLPDLQHVIVVRDEAPLGTIALPELLAGVGPDESPEDLLFKLRPTATNVMHLAPTGGTTGLPKLVPITHNAMLTKAYYQALRLELGPRDIVLIFAPNSHAASQLISTDFMALFGGKVVLQSSTKAKDILGQIEKEKITSCFVVPTLLADIVHDPDFDKFDLSSMQVLYWGAAHCPVELVRTVHNRFPNCSLHSAYGMTEGPGTITRFGDPFDIVAHTVGQPVCPYDEYKTVDDADRELAAGQEGELVARGPCMFSGYYKSEEEEQSLDFTPDGFIRTGDLGKFDEGGNLIITGRKKDVINRGGETVSAFEVEELILSHPRVRRAAAIGMPDQRLGERICAYVEPAPGAGLRPEDIVSHVKSEGASLLLLPERIEMIEEMPLTAVGKLDKKALMEDITQKLRVEGRI